MPREKDSFRDHVVFLPDKRWECKFCSKVYSGSVTRIKAHLAGVAGYGINDCKDVDGRVRSEARNALKGKRAAEPSSGAEGNVEERPHLPVTANNEDTWREPSFAATPYLSSEVRSTVGASYAFLPLPETNLPSQSLLAQSMIPPGDCSFWPQQPQSQAGDSSNQAWNYLSSRPDFVPEALTNMPAPVNAEEGEPNTEAPQDARTDDALMDSRSGTFGLAGEYMPTLKRKMEELSRRGADLDELETWCRKSKTIKDSMVQAFREGQSFLAQQVERVDDLSKDIEEILGYCSFQRGLTTHAATRVAGEIGGDGRTLLLKNVRVLEVGRCDGVISLCEIGPLDILEELTIEEWEKLEELGTVHFPHLRRLKITWCSKLKLLLEEGQRLPRLQWFRIEGSEELEEINMVAPLLYNIEVYECPKMKRAVEWERLATRLPNLRSIKIRNCEKLEEIIGGGPAMPIGATCLLTEFELYGCNNMKGALLTHDMLLRLPYLQDITVQDCKGIEVIIGTVPDMMTHPSRSNLLGLTLRNLPELKSICDGIVIVSWILFRLFDIKNCPKLKRLPLADNGLPFPPLYLESIRINHLTWESLEYPPPSLRSILINWVTWGSSEWVYPFSSCSLEDLVWFHEDFFNERNQKRPITIESCDSIAARVDGEIGGDGYSLLLKDAPVLIVGRGSGVTSLSEVGPLENLEDLTIEEWEKLEELGPVHFPRLRELHITRCSKLKNLLEDGQGLSCLRSLYIEGSEELEGIKLVAPSLNHMQVSECPKMKRAVEWEWLATRLPNLKSFGIYDCEKLEEIISGPLPMGATCLFTVLQIFGCNNMKGVLLTHDMLAHLPFLQEIRVVRCEGIEVIMGTVLDMTHPFRPNLIRLILMDLPKLNSICDGMVSCDSIRYYTILNCPKLKRIPLRLGPLHNGVPSPPPLFEVFR